MSPPLSKKHLEILNTEFYKNKYLFGRDKMFNLLRNKYEDEAPSRRQIADFLKNQEINQLYHPSKGKPQTFITSMTSAPNTILAIDLLDLQKNQIRGFKYLLNGIDMSSRFMYNEALKTKQTQKY
jgi:hypothetical protein